MDSPGAVWLAIADEIDRRVALISQSGRSANVASAGVVSGSMRTVARQLDASEPDREQSVSGQGLTK